MLALVFRQDVNTPPIQHAVPLILKGRLSLGSMPFFLALRNGAAAATQGAPDA